MSSEIDSLFLTVPMNIIDNPDKEQEPRKLKTNPNRITSMTQSFKIFSKIFMLQLKYFPKYLHFKDNNIIVVYIILFILLQSKRNCQ